MKEKKGHVFIATTGCAGSSLLMAIFIKLGMDTGFEFMPPTCPVADRVAYGGEYETKMFGWMGSDNNDKGFPYIIKSTKICSTMIERQEKFGYEIDHVYCLFRDPWMASVKERVTRYVKEGQTSEELWRNIRRAAGSKDIHRARITGAELKLKRTFLALCLTVAKHDIPNTLLVYPHYMVDLPTTYKKLEFLMTKYSISYERFKEVCDELVDQEVLDIALGYVKETK